jgi:hypothetical protein
MNTITINELTKRGYIEIDYNKPLSHSISIGDIVITTDMYVFDGFRDKVEINIKKLDSLDILDFIIIAIDDEFDLIQTPYDMDDPEKGWFNPNGRIFVKKNEIKYVEILVPDFIVNKVVEMGGKMK